ncbi:MAG: hypothetical protein BTN85_1980 [Candidatus Methanohalarchaeum thermophilum]|uniref:Uncharacterized protein n=1 Tax=Methanohalarchaeum thermophilum TaxID=1903181 RepID=A0A1Q6DSH5_METT1|nr:MAG: hypothetical protein BTN85_1980 [Candidatus Methanohalarchaeum thermophilum]
MNLNKLNKQEINLYLYNEPCTENFDLDEIQSYLKEKTGFNAIKRTAFVKQVEDRENFAKKLASTRIKDEEKGWDDLPPLPNEISFEKKILKNPEKRLTSVVYDGNKLAKSFLEEINQEEKNWNDVHLIYTNRLFGTHKEKDGYNLRVVIYGLPSLISTSGIVEAPKKPKKYYQNEKKRTFNHKTIDQIEEAKKKYNGKFIDYDDKRITKALKGYSLQAILNQLLGTQSCPNQKCRLHNPNLQNQVIKSQLKKPEFCKKHKKLIKKIKTK